MGINVPQDIIAVRFLKHVCRIVNRSRRGSSRPEVLRKMSSFGKFWRDRSRFFLGNFGGIEVGGFCFWRFFLEGFLDRWGDAMDCFVVY